MKKEIEDARLRRERYDAQHPIRDYHDFTYPSMPRSELDKLHVGHLYINGAVCLSCNSFIRSRNKHDYVTCRCGEISVDGGSHYHKVSFKNKDTFKSITVAFKENPDEIFRSPSNHVQPAEDEGGEPA